MSYTSLGAMLALSMVLSTRIALGFCGFYVAKADTQLFNKASKVALVRHDGKTVMTMANDYRGDPQEFALVVPVPTFLERDQIHVGERALLDHLDAYSAPRLVEYFDENPCRPRPLPAPMAAVGRTQQAPSGAADKSLGVTVEARYTVGEYDIVISDMYMPGASGLDLLNLAHQSHWDIAVILITGHPKVEEVVAAMRLHVSDFLFKPLSIEL